VRERYYIYRASCRKDIRLQPRNGVYFLLDGCQACGIVAESNLQQLLEVCARCSSQLLQDNRYEIKVKPMENKVTAGGDNEPVGGLPVMTAPPPGGIALAVEAPMEAVVTLPEQIVTPDAHVEAVYLQLETTRPHPEISVQPMAPTLLAEPTSAVASCAEVAAYGTPESAYGTPEAALLTELILGSGEDAVNVEAVLDSIPGMVGGPSVGGFSWHTLELPMHCWRKAYYNLVMGLRAKGRQLALDFGSTYHACWALWYNSGGQRRYDEPCDALRQAGAPKLAGLVQRLVYTELCKYAVEEASEWDIRGVETNAVFWGEPERINGKLVYVPNSCRHDMLLAKRAPGAPCAPPGPVASGILIVDRKTASALTYDLSKGYGSDGQFLMNALVYTRSDEEKVFGPFVGMVFSVAVKHKEPAPEKSYFRVETTVDEVALAEFYRDCVRPYSIELYRRLSMPEYRNDPTKWPRNRASCVGRWGCCTYFDICDGGESIIDLLFRVDKKGIFDLEKLAPPPAEMKRAAAAADPKKQVSAVARKDRSEQRKHHSASLMSALCTALLGLEHFNPKRFLIVNHTKASVLKQLFEVLKGMWPLETAFQMMGADGESFNIAVVERGLSWTMPIDGKKDMPKGKISWKAVAESICKDWWSLDNLDPRGK